MRIEILCFIPLVLLLVTVTRYCVTPGRGGGEGQYIATPLGKLVAGNLAIDRGRALAQIFSSSEDIHLNSHLLA